jgi:hypothetical protein
MDGGILIKTGHFPGSNRITPDLRSGACLMSEQLLTLPNRRNHITKKVRIPGRTLYISYISVNDDPAPAEVFLGVKGVGGEASALMPPDAF